uniref:Uncharacterized protein n=1 Tax=Helianthus annuus TaxID=4232 RepID=A0A251S527_HELAN
MCCFVSVCLTVEDRGVSMFRSTVVVVDVPFETTGVTGDKHCVPWLLALCKGV